MARLTLVARKMVATTIASQAMVPGEATADSGATKENAQEIISVPGSIPIPQRRKGAELVALADKMEKGKGNSKGKGSSGGM